MDLPLLADHLALDFVGTISERTTTRLEHLPDARELDAWLVAAGVLDKPPGSTPGDLVTARHLREAIYAAVRDATSDAPVSRASLRVINAAASSQPVRVHLTATGRARRTGPTAAALSDIARAAITLLSGDDIERVRWCADDTCTHPFLDRSRGGRRRWCGMAGCGDRAKARAYRARRRGDI